MDTAVSNGASPKVLIGNAQDEAKAGDFLLETPVGDLPIFHRTTTYFLRDSDFTVVGDVVANSAAEFAVLLQSYYSNKFNEPQEVSARRAAKQFTAIAAWLQANNIEFAETTITDSS